MKALSPLTPSVLGLLFGVVLIVLVGASVVLLPGGPTDSSTPVLAAQNISETTTVVVPTPGITKVAPTEMLGGTPIATAMQMTPVPTVLPTAVPPAKYTVVAGDTIEAIAEQFGVSAEEIAKANKLDDIHSLQEGQVLTIPPLPTATAAPASTEVATTPVTTPVTTETASPTPNPSTSVYVVESGDTLSGIAEKVGVSAKEIIEANGLTEDDILSEGQKLTIPTAQSATAIPTALASAAQVYVVQEGDTLLGIADKAAVDVEALKRYNGIGDNDTLNIGQRITIP